MDCGNALASPPQRESGRFQDAWGKGPANALPRQEACVNRWCMSAVLSAGFGLLLAGCGSNTDVSTIQITPATQGLAAGQTAQFTATGIITHGKHPASTQDVTALVTWASNAPAIASISSSGAATAVSAGTATITASMAGAISATATITVTGGGTVNPNSDIVKLTVIPGSQAVASPTQTSQFIAIGTNASGGTIDLTHQAVWNASAVQIATVGANTGLATGVGKGSTTITAIYTNPDKTVVTGTATFEVISGTTELVTELTIYPGSQSTTALDQQTRFFVLGKEGSSGLQFDVTDKVVWTSSNTAVATIGTNGNGTPGLAKSIGSGSSSITATYTNPDNSKVVATATYSANIGAAQEPLLSINVVPGDTTVSNKGMTAQYLAFGTFSTSPTIRDITNSVTWVSTTPEVASIVSCGSGPAVTCGSGTSAPPSGGLPGEYAGLATSQGYSGNTVIYALDYSSNPDGTVVLSNPVNFTCRDSDLKICVQDVPIPQFATITIFIEGEQNAPSGVGEFVTAPSDTGTPDLIHCGKDYSGSGGQVCTGTYAVGSKITLTENLAAGSKYFGGWSTGSGCVHSDGTALSVAELATSTTCTVSVNRNTGLWGNISVGVIFY
jgi:Bacterial Ig-like domain (group 2)